MNEKLSLDTYGPILVYEIEGENLVPLISNGKSFGYKAISIECDYDDFFSYFGYLNEYKLSLKEEKIKEINKVKESYKQAISKEYFDSTKELTIEFKRVIDEYEAFSKRTKARNKKYYKNPIYLNFRDFVRNHPEINNPLDIRFNTFYYEELINDPARPNVKMVSHFYDYKPDVDYDTYRDFIEFSYPKLLERVSYYCDETIKGLESEVENVKKGIKELLKEHDKVGLVYLYSGDPKRYLEKYLNSIDEFDEDIYIRLKGRIIYWFFNKKPAKID